MALVEHMQIIYFVNNSSFAKDVFFSVQSVYLSLLLVYP